MKRVTAKSVTALFLASILSVPLMLAQAQTSVTSAPAIGGARQQQQTVRSITLSVDAREAPRKILHATLSIPVAPGPLTLVYPKWIPGEHGPTGPIVNLAGLKFTAGGRTVAWQRDLTDMYAFNCEVPAGANTIDVALDFLLSANPEGFTSAASASSQLAVINWNQLVLYPQGVSPDALTYTMSLRLPAGWKFGTALPVEKDSRDVVSFKPVSLTTLIDSPLITGNYFRVIPLNPGQTPVHEIDMAADSAAALEMSAEQIASYKQLVAEAGALFGARHYTQYHFLFALSDYVASFGLEHHESSDDRVAERTLLEPALFKTSADLLPHEFVHSWNGKYRRPAGLVTSDFQQPMKTDLLWVYEGLTQYLGYLLTARSGLWTPEEYRQFLAQTAAYLDNNRTGRNWRPLVDTATAAQLLYEAPGEWASVRRSVDFYDEGILIWLEADVLIRQQTNGRRSLDDFCRRFHGGQSGAPMVITYTFEDVVAALNQIAPYDWRNFFVTRVNNINARAPIGGINAGGWQLVYTNAPNEFLDAVQQASKTVDASYSIGLKLREDGTVSDVIAGLAAAQAGIGPGMKLIAVGGRRFSGDALREAIRNSKTNSSPVEMIVENGEYYTTYRLNYHDGEKYPHLQRDAARPDTLEQILKPLVMRSASPRR